MCVRVKPTLRTFSWHTWICLGSRDTYSKCFVYTDTDGLIVIPRKLERKYQNNNNITNWQFSSELLLFFLPSFTVPFQSTVFSLDIEEMRFFDWKLRIQKFNFSNQMTENEIELNRFWARRLSMQQPCSKQVIDKTILHAKQIDLEQITC